MTVMTNRKIQFMPPDRLTWPSNVITPSYAVITFSMTGIPKSRAPKDLRKTRYSSVVAIILDWSVSRLREDIKRRVRLSRKIPRLDGARDRRDDETLEPQLTIISEVATRCYRCDTESADDPAFSCSREGHAPARV